MMVAYGLISLELYQGIKFDASQKKSARGNYLLSVGLCQKITQALFSITYIYPEYILLKILFKSISKYFSKVFLGDFVSEGMVMRPSVSASCRKKKLFLPKGY